MGRLTMGDRTFDIVVIAVIIIWAAMMIGVVFYAFSR
jgi:hypothetical protein